MNELLDKIAKKRRCLSHKLYVKSVMAQIQNEIAKDANEVSPESGKQELFENILNQYI